MSCFFDYFNHLIYVLSVNFPYIARNQNLELGFKWLIGLFANDKKLQNQSAIQGIGLTDEYLKSGNDNL